MKEELNNILNILQPISLGEMDKVSLLSRIDSKYVTHINKLPQLLNLVNKDYFVLEITDKRIFNYQTLYFDTDDLKMYIAHHNGKLNRYKIRKREYVDSSLNFLEVKFKNNKGRTIKKRVVNYNINDTFSEVSKDFLIDNTPFNYSDIKGKIITTFNRITLVNKELTERLTIDTELVFKNSESKKELKNMIIIELKQDRYADASIIKDTLKELRIFPGRFSKYCFGTAMINDKVKSNNFKPALMDIYKRF